MKNAFLFFAVQFFRDQKFRIWYFSKPVVICLLACLMDGVLFYFLLMLIMLNEFKNLSDDVFGMSITN